MAKVLIGGVWPYANGSLHLGRLASLLPGGPRTIDGGYFAQRRIIQLYEHYW